MQACNRGALRLGEAWAKPGEACFFRPSPSRLSPGRNTVFVPVERIVQHLASSPLWEYQKRAWTPTQSKYCPCAMATTRSKTHKTSKQKNHKSTKQNKSKTKQKHKTNEARRGVGEATPRTQNVLAQGQSEAHVDPKLCSTIVEVPVRLNLK